MIKQFAGDPGWSVARLRAWIALCVFFCGTSAGVTSEVAVKVSPDESTPAAAGPVPAAEPLSARVAADAVVEATDTAEYSGEIYKIGLGWHPSALQEFTRDKFGLVNWVATLNDKKINPRSSIDPQAVETPPFDLNIVMPSKTGMIEGAHFPHKAHTAWLACESCHTKIFIPLAGANDLNMSKIVEGKACGVCHGKVAFPLNDCERCHVPQPASADTAAAAR